MVYIASDHAGFETKQKTIEFLNQNKIAFEDIGPYEFNKDDDYPDFAFKLGETVVEKNGKGIIICGSGVGVCIACNKVKGVRAGYAESEEHAIESRTDDDTNILVLDAMTFNPEIDFAIITTWLNTVFSEEERYVRRIKKIEEYENRGVV